MKRFSRYQARNKRVLLRVDFNVPIAKGRLGSDFRIRGHLATIRRLRALGNTVILLAHHSDRKQTLQPVALFLSRTLNADVTLVGDPLKKPWDFFPREKKIFLFENLRFWPGEERADAAFAKKLARWGSVFVDDAFSVAHRRAASTTVLPKLLPSYLGPYFEHELALLDSLMARPARPLVAVFGGAKTETKLPLLKRFNTFADYCIVGGAVANTLLAAERVSVGSSKVDIGALAALRGLARSPKLILPTDVAVSRTPNGAGLRIIQLEKLKPSEAIWDVGPKTLRVYREILHRARTVVWNGPLGLVETKVFRKGTRDLARSLLRSHAKVIVGGGDTIAFLGEEHLLSKFKHVSSGGGAMLAYLGGEKLPGLEALKT